MQNKKLIAFNIKETVNHNHWIEFVSFSNNEQLLAFCSADIVTIVELEQNASYQLLHDTVVWRCAFVDNDAYIISTGSNGFLYKWNLVQRTQSLSKKLHKDTIFGLSVHPHEPIVITGGRDGAIVCYNHDTDTILTALRGHTDSVEDVAFSLCGSFIASGSKDKVVLLWNSYLDKDQVSAVSFTGHRHYVTKCAFSNDSKLLATVSYDKRIGIWSIKERCLISFLRGHTNIIWGCVFISNDMLMTCSSDKSVRYSVSFRISPYYVR